MPRRLPSGDIEMDDGKIISKNDPGAASIDVGGDKGDVKLVKPSPKPSPVGAGPVLKPTAGLGMADLARVNAENNKIIEAWRAKQTPTKAGYPAADTQSKALRDKKKE